MSLFGNREEKAARPAAAQAETERLGALSVADLASEIMPAFGPDRMQIRSGHQEGAMEVTSWLLSAFSGSVKYRQPVLGPVIERAGGVADRHCGGTWIPNAEP